MNDNRAQCVWRKPNPESGAKVRDAAPSPSDEYKSPFHRNEIAMWAVCSRPPAGKYGTGWKMMRREMPRAWNVPSLARRMKFASADERGANTVQFILPKKETQPSLLGDITSNPIPRVDKLKSDEWTVFQKLIPYSVHPHTSRKRWFSFTDFSKVITNPYLFV